MARFNENPDYIPTQPMIKQIYGPLKIECKHDFKVTDIALSSEAIAIIEYTLSVEKNTKYNQLDLSLERTDSSSPTSVEVTSIVNWTLLNAKNQSPLTENIEVE